VSAQIKTRRLIGALWALSCYRFQCPERLRDRECSLGDCVSSLKTSNWSHLGALRQTLTHLATVDDNRLARDKRRGVREQEYGRIGDVVCPCAVNILSCGKTAGKVASLPKVPQRWAGNPLPLSAERPDSRRSMPSVSEIGPYTTNRRSASSLMPETKTRDSDTYWSDDIGPHAMGTVFDSEDAAECVHACLCR
jgi:hypothetical protein